MSAPDYVILGAVALAAVCAVAGRLRARKRCKGSCGGCPRSGQCGGFR